jgi:hypothetical protein
MLMMSQFRCYIGNTGTEVSSKVRTVPDLNQTLKFLILNSLSKYRYPKIGNFNEPELNVVCYKSASTLCKYLRGGGGEGT